MRIIFILVPLFFCSYLFSQDYSSISGRAVKFYEKANEHFQKQEDRQAEDLLWKALDSDDEFAEAWFMLAQIYSDKREDKKAVDYYLNGLSIDPDKYASGFLLAANMEYEIGMYEDAKEHLETWKIYDGNDEGSRINAKELGGRIDFAIQSVRNPVPFEPIPLEETVNSKQSEYWPSLSVDEKTIFFTVLGPQNAELKPTRMKLQEDFYYADKEHGSWGQRKYLDTTVNTNYNEGAQSVTADGKFMYYTACNRPDGHGRMCDIYYSRIREDGSWSRPVNLGSPVNTGRSEKHPSISADGRVLIFTSDRSGGHGDYDLWMSIKNGDEWLDPVNLGDSINTSGVEQSPFLHPDQQTLYFSSDGWPGMGKGDIFISRRKADGTWSAPENLGFPINTHNEEIGFIVNAKGTRAYYSTNRREGTDIDIYTFELPKDVRPIPVSYITGRVYDSENMRGIEAKFRLIDIETEKMVMESVSEPGEGNYLVPLPAGAMYAFNVSHPGYLFYSDNFELRNMHDRQNPFRKDIALNPIKSGKKIVLNNIFFDFDSYQLKEDSRVELEMVIEFLKKNEGLRIEISGHTDTTGDDTYNMELSEKRAGEVVQYLVNKGIDADRLESRGYGDTMPIKENTTEEGRAANRRTEMKVL
ncbi:MAG: OmpA family protein [Bacteroidales bacterium]|nr:OmpA family protein [Bacteroidales bacterium]